MLKTVEIPLAGHPDKLCDRIVDAIVDEYVRRDPNSRVDIQALGGHGMLMIGGTVDSRADFDCAAIVKRVHEKAGYLD
ncbi:MAG: methionine adenosyltransferase, partial [Candidatus Magasanikbacteria bacterium CG10_big_fil_rev_8_21_14_0_10_38_6]